MNLRELRDKRKLTQEQLASMSGVDQSTICLLEKVPGRKPAYETAIRLAKALEVSPEELFPVDTDSAA